MQYVPPIGSVDPDAPYVEGNPATGTRGSFPPARGFEATMREVVNAITGAGLTPADGDLTQLTQAIQQLATARGAPTGVICPFAGAAAPSGWLLCYGQAVSRTTYASLFAAIGVVYGIGDGSTTFNVPDLRGRVIAGKDDMGGVAASRLTSGTITGGAATLGKVGGEEKHQLVKSEMPLYDLTVTDNGHVHGVQRANIASSGVQYSLFGAAGSQPDRNTESATTGISVSSAGSDTPHNNVQPTIIGNYIIRT
jgi:microcystin-dependent protein